MKKGRGKAASTIAIGEAAYDVLYESRWPMTLRMTYYALVSRGVIPKTDAAYNQLKRILRDLREDGSIPWDWIIDNHRVVNAARTWNGIEGLLDDAATMYRRDLMRTQDVAIQVWAESDSVGSVVANVARRYAIPTFIGRGYSSRGYLWSAAGDAVDAAKAGKSVIVLHVGDYDPSGEDIFRDVEETLRTYAFAQERELSAEAVRQMFEGLGVADEWTGASVLDASDLLAMDTPYLTFRRVALTPDQIARHDLPSRPAKTTDVRTASFRGIGTVEVEALPVDVLLGIVDAAILDYIDEDALKAARLAEASEREIAKRIAATPLAKLVEAVS